MPLRPLGLGEIYDGAFQAVRSNPAAMVGAAAVVVAVMTALQLVVEASLFGSLGSMFAALEPDTAGNPGDIDTQALISGASAVGAGALLSQVISVVALSVLTALATIVVGNAVLGRSTAGGELWRRVRSRVLPLIGLTLLVGLVIGAAVVAALVPGIALLFALPVAGVLVLLLGVVAAIALWAWLDTRWAMAGPALLLEEQGVLAAMRRSWRLTSRGFWRVLGIRMLTLVIVIVTMAIVSAPFGLVATVVAGPVGDPSDPFAALDPTLPELLLTGIGSALAATIVYPFAAAVTALLYVDQRIRLEALDVELARAASQPPP